MFFLGRPPPEEQEEKEEEKEEGAGFDIKSNRPNLKGWEQTERLKPRPA